MSSLDQGQQVIVVTVAEVTVMETIAVSVMVTVASVVAETAVSVAHVQTTDQDTSDLGQRKLLHRSLTMSQRCSSLYD